MKKFTKFHPKRRIFNQTDCQFENNELRHFVSRTTQSKTLCMLSGSVHYHQQQSSHEENYILPRLTEK